MGFLHLSVHFLEFGLLLIKKRKRKYTPRLKGYACLLDVLSPIVLLYVNYNYNNLNRVASLPHTVASCVVSGTRALLLKGPEMRRLVISLQCGIRAGKALSQRFISVT